MPDSFVADTPVQSDSFQPDSFQPDAAPRSWLDSAKDFAEGAWNNLVQSGQGIVNLAARPLNTIAQMGQSQDEVRQKAEKAFQSGNYAEGVRHVLGYVLPGVGPALDQLGDQAQAGEVAKALGGATSLGLQLAGPELAGAAARGVGTVAGKVGDSIADAAARNALKGGYTVNTPAAEVDAAARTLRQNNIPFSAEGAQKISDALNDLRTAVVAKTDAAAKAGVTISPQAVLNRLDQLKMRYASQVNPDQDLAAINRVGKNFSQNNPGPIPADTAQAMKAGSNAVNAAKYGEASQAQIEAEKALTRGLKEELENQIPELTQLNAKQAEYIGLDKVFSKALNKYVNQGGFGGAFMRNVADLRGLELGGAGGVAAATGHTELAGAMAGAQLMRGLLADPLVRTKLMIAINKAQQMNPAKWGAPNLGTAMGKIARLQAGLGAALSAPTGSQTSGQQ